MRDENYRRSKVTIIFFAILIIFLAWVGLTKAGFLPNFLHLQELKPRLKEQINSSSEPSENPKKSGPLMAAKPVIYLYPEQKQNVRVSLDYQGEIIADYPKYDQSINGWEVTAYPNGTIVSHADNKEYSYLFWEGMPEKAIDWDITKGFVIKGQDTAEFLQEKLAEIGLTPKEYNEFIVYWYPRMKNNQYNLIHFAGEKYTNTAPLTITPKPDSILRVFMVYKPIDEKIQLTAQKFKPFVRQGFTVVEWGGTKLK